MKTYGGEEVEEVSDQLHTPAALNFVTMIRSLPYQVSNPDRPARKQSVTCMS